MPLNGSKDTGAMRNHPAPLDLFLSALLDQPQQSMECAASLEGTDSLQVLALEVESEVWPRGRLALEWRVHQGPGRLRGRGDGVESFAG